MNHIEEVLQQQKLSTLATIFDQKILYCDSRSTSTDPDGSLEFTLNAIFPVPGHTDCYMHLLVQYMVHGTTGLATMHSMRGAVETPETLYPRVSKGYLTKYETATIDSPEYQRIMDMYVYWCDASEVISRVWYSGRKAQVV